MRTVKQLKIFLDHFKDADLVCAWCPDPGDEDCSEGITISTKNGIDIGFFGDHDGEQDWIANITPTAE
jgi:hypothetical protein